MTCASTAPALTPGSAGAPEIEDISVVIPCYNEELNAQAIAAAVIAELEKTGASFEILFIDNCSTDRTVPIIREMCLRDPRIRLIVNTRNFGQMRSPTHGIFAARGRAVIGMCADFQDSPALLPHFVERWRAGVDIVLGVREAEDSGTVLRLVRGLSYWLAKNFGDFQTIPNATGFGLYSRRVVDAIKALNEPEPFYRALLVETGFPLETIGYVRPPPRAWSVEEQFLHLARFCGDGVDRLLQAASARAALLRGGRHRDRLCHAGWRRHRLLYRASHRRMADRQRDAGAGFPDLRLPRPDG